MRQVDRRTFLRGTAATAGAMVLGGPFQGFAARAANAATRAAPSFPLGPVEDMRDGVVRLWLPRGFHYRSFHDTETPVTLPDRTVLPGRHDGMASFPGPGENLYLVRNHEVNAPGNAFGPGTPYDAMARGGTTTIEVTPKGKVVDAFTSLNGTQMNCSGGPMPWGSWITCEETVNGPDVGPDFTGVSNVPLLQPHGFIFEVPAGGQSTREPITAAGRFAHEAVAFDPNEGILYLTEDNFAFPSGFYRYVPRHEPDATRAPSTTTDSSRCSRSSVSRIWSWPRRRQRVRRTTSNGSTSRIPAPEFPYTPGAPAPTTNDQALVYVGNQGRAQGAAFFSRLEGSVYEDGVVYFTSTQGGGAAPPGPNSVTGYGNGTGQVWGYRVEDQVLECVFQSPGAGGAGLPRQRHHEPAGDADPLRGQHGRQLHPRPHEGG